MVDAKIPEGTVDIKRAAELCGVDQNEIDHIELWDYNNQLAVFLKNGERKLIVGRFAPSQRIE